MNRSRWIARLKYTAWSVLLIDLLLLILFADRTLSNLVLAVLLVLGLLFSALIAVVILPFLYMRHMRHWWYWGVLLGLLAIDLLAIQRIVPQEQTLASLIQFISFFAWIALIVSLCIQLARYDLSVSVMGWPLLIGVWSIALFVVQGQDIFEVLLQGLTSTPSLSIWWIEHLATGLVLLSPIAGSSFLWHSGRILLREIYDASPILKRTAE